MTSAESHLAMKPVQSRHLTLLLMLLVGSAGPSSTQAQENPGTILNRVGFDQKLGHPVPLDVLVQDESGARVPLGTYFNPTRPVILALVYYNCPMLCTQVLNGLTRSLKPLSLEPGSDFDVVTLSIDPRDTPELATLKKRNYLKLYGREGREQGWHFLTSDQTDAIERIADAVGFRYSYNPASGQYAHAAGIIVLTADGRPARYFFGIDYSPRDVQFGLMEASAGRIGSPISKVLLLCYDYDAASGKYTLSILRLSQILGCATVVALAATVLLLLRRERRHQAPANPVLTD